MMLYVCNYDCAFLFSVKYIKKRCKCKSFFDDAKKHVNVAEPMIMTQIDLSRGKDKKSLCSGVTEQLYCATSFIFL